MQLLGKKNRCFILLNALVLMCPVLFLSVTFHSVEPLCLNHERNFVPKQKSPYTMST